MCKGSGCVHVCVRAHSCVCAQVWVCMCVCTWCVSAHVWVCKGRGCAPVCVCIALCVRVHMVCVCMCVCMHGGVCTQGFAQGVVHSNVHTGGVHRWGCVGARGRVCMAVCVQPCICRSTLACICFHGCARMAVCNSWGARSHVHMRVGSYVCVGEHTCVCMCPCMHACVHKHASMHVLLYEYLCARVCAHVSVSVSVSVCTHVHAAPATRPGSCGFSPVPLPFAPGGSRPLTAEAARGPEVTNGTAAASSAGKHRHKSCKRFFFFALFFFFQSDRSPASEAVSRHRAQTRCRPQPHTAPRSLNAPQSSSQQHFACLASISPTPEGFGRGRGSPCVHHGVPQTPAHLPIPNSLLPACLRVPCRFNR